MKPLIRPFLFAVARLGLFLAVVAWLTGRFWTCESHMPRFVIKLTDRGVAISHRASFDEWDFSVKRANDNGWLFNDWLFGEDVELLPVYSPFRNDGGPSRHIFIGFTQAYAYGAQIIAVHHWLITSYFALLYVVLKWVYRERSTPTVL